jgi:hypothetical protein
MEFIKNSFFVGIGTTLLQYVVLYFVIKYAVKSALKEDK